MRVARGRQIDDSAAVFRVNAAPTRRFEPYVGRRTTLRFWGARTSPTGGVVYGYHAKLAKLPEEANVTPVVSCPPVRWLDRCWSEIGLAVMNNHSNASVSEGNASRGSHGSDALLTPSQRRGVQAPRLNPSHKILLRNEMRRATRTSNMRQHPSTGAVAVHVALQLCARVSIYGFGNSSCLPKARHKSRYYDAVIGLRNYLREMARLGHDYETQQAWLRGLVAGGHLTDAEGCFG